MEQAPGLLPRGQGHRPAARSRDPEPRNERICPREAKTNLLGMPRQALESFFEDLGEKPYRATQVMRWIYGAKVTDIGAMTDISKSLRSRLKEIAEIRAPPFSAGRQSSDGVIKWLAYTEHDQAVETVLIPEDGRGHPGKSAGDDGGSPSANGRNTLCISSQVGCSLDCSFCATGKQGFNGNLTRAEIVGQVWQADRELRERGDERGITNVVFMGMGEPLLNFEPVLDATDVLMDDLGFGISKRRVTISTAGVVPRIHDMAARTDVSLAVSLHAARDELRDTLVPLNRKYPIAELLDACRHYLRGLGERRNVTMEYTLIEGVNDSARDARELADLLTGLRAKVNLIPFNPFPEDRNGYRRPAPSEIANFQASLLNAGISAMLRATRGEEIGAACGQLTGSVHDRTRRRVRYLARERNSVRP
ncbi:MAG: 23S rRNA (adenine(2503)-C(2))-methyltransferase RlmN [Gammaproteobacteria bacterium]|nr:23S rRNA (adenine(2503)-C(2))-methyltransferase RlmN [Gammaproteobacteria bacterium]